MVTVRDVAREADVSISTVSRALSSPERVAPATRARVTAAVAQLGYRPNRAAAGLRAGRTGTFGLVVADLENPYFASVTKGVQARANTLGHGVFVVDIDEDAGREADEVRSLLDQTDGVVLVSPRSSDERLAELAAGDGGTRPRLVLVNRRLHGVPSVTADDVAGADRALAHLRALGHRRVAYVGGPTSSWSDLQRRTGLRQAAERAGDVELVLLGAFRPQVQGGYSAADLAIGSGATAVVAYNDVVAVGLLARLRARGIDVPGDVSVVGFDDTFVAEVAAPPLTSVGPDLRGLGEDAVDLLVDADGPRRLVRPTDLAVRASTGPARLSTLASPRSDR